MLHTLIIKGKKEVKKVIISAIIEQVQQPGSTPPEDVPALMEILRRTAEEQLEIVTSGSDEKALGSALQFGRWVRLPALMLGEARNNFKQAQDFAKKRELELQRRRELGLPEEDEDGAGDESSPSLRLDHREEEVQVLSSSQAAADALAGKQQLQQEARGSGDGEGRRDGPSAQTTQRTSRGGRRSSGATKAGAPKIGAGGRLISGSWSATASRERAGEADRKRAEQRSEDEARRRKKQEAARAQARLVIETNKHRVLVAEPSRRRAERFWRDKNPAELKEAMRMFEKRAGTDATEAGASSARGAGGVIGRWFPAQLQTIPETNKLMYFERDAGPSIYGREDQLDSLVNSRAAASKLLQGVKGRPAKHTGTKADTSALWGDSMMFDPNAPPLSRSADVWKGKLRVEGYEFPNKDEWMRWSEKPRRSTTASSSSASVTTGAPATATSARPQRGPRKEQPPATAEIVPEPPSTPKEEDASSRRG